MTRDSTSPVLVLYAMSGFTGLLAEQALERYTTLLVGVTASASAVVLFTYFLGFAIGGFAAGQLLRRGSLRRSLRAYGLVELSVGIACAVFTYAFHPAMEALAPLQGLVAGTLARQVVRFACSCVLILPIAALMGASFPLIAQSLDNSGPRRWSVAYSYNLAGAVIAALTAPYLILPAIGLRGSMWLIFAICATIAIAAQFLGDPAPLVAVGRATSAARPRLNRDSLLLLGTSFLSGLVFFALEVIWAHLIGTVIGGSVYAFSSMLAAVLTGLWIGAAFVNRKSRDEALPTWVLLAACALALLIQFKSWEQVCRLFLIPGPGIYRGFYTRELYRLLMAMILIVPPAVLLGMIYPRLLRTPIAKRDGGAWLAGYLSAANSVGCLLGALAATFLFVPLLGSEMSLKAIIVVLAAMAIVFVAREAGQPRGARAVAVGMIAVLGVAVVPMHWDWASLTTGVPMYFGEVMKSDVATPPVTPRPEAKHSLIFRDENIQGGFTTVVDTVGPGTRMRSMYTNGKLQGNDDVHGEFGLNFGIVFIPAMFTGRFDRALLIGLGTGQSAWLLRQAGFQAVDIAEFSPGIVRAASEKFTHINHGILSDANVRVILEDGRNLLLVEAGRKYNLITVELTTIWFSGATNLYSREFYELARRRLEADGILQQWVQLHRIGPEAISSALATARSVFPYVAYWSYGGQGMIIAGNHPLVMNAERNSLLADRLNKCPDLTPDRARQIMQEIVHAELVGSAGVDGLIASRHPVVNTDHNRFIEYDTPRYSSSERDWRAYNVAFFQGWNRRPSGF